MSNTLRIRIDKNTQKRIKQLQRILELKLGVAEIPMRIIVKVAINNIDIEEFIENELNGHLEE